jgi:hypothetical protein
LREEVVGVEGLLKKSVETGFEFEKGEGHLLVLLWVHDHGSARVLRLETPQGRYLDVVCPRVTEDFEFLDQREETVEDSEAFKIICFDEVIETLDHNIVNERVDELRLDNIHDFLFGLPLEEAVTSLFFGLQSGLNVSYVFFRFHCRGQSCCFCGVVFIC